MRTISKHVSRQPHAPLAEADLTGRVKMTYAGCCRCGASVSDAPWWTGRESNPRTRV